MSWFKVDDGFGSSPKVMSIPRSERMACIGLWVTAGAWSAQHLTDGRVPFHMLEEWGADSSQGDILAQVGLWDEDDAGWVFHDWSDYQPTRVATLANRERERVRKEEWRTKNRANTGQSHAGTETSGANASQHPDPTRPDPTRPVPKGTQESATHSSSEIAHAIPRPELDHLCNLLADLIEANGSKRPTIGKRWIEACRLLIDRDGRTPDQVENAIRWCQADEFWRTNILSMSKLREKYDQLRLAATRHAQPVQMSKAARNAAEYQRLFGGDHDPSGRIQALDAGVGA